MAKCFLFTVDSYVLEEIWRKESFVFLELEGFCMHYFITGGAGFIGSHLCEYLLEQGHRVSVLDNLSTGSMDNILHLKGNSLFSYEIDSVTNVPLLGKMVSECDIVIHLAAAVGVNLVVESPVQTIHTNVDGTEFVLKEANKKKKKVLIASTSEVYGKSNKIPFQEEDDLILGPPTKGRWSYACSKALDEFLALAYWREKKLPVVICRFFNTVGPRQTGRYGMVLPRFIKQALSNSPITVYGDGTQSRCFIYVGEVCKAIYSLTLEDKAVGEIYNIGSQEEITIADLAHRVRDKVGISTEIKYIPYHDAYTQGFEDMQRRVPCIKKIHQLLGFLQR